jgi:hypothetical protein
MSYAITTDLLPSRTHRRSGTAMQAVRFLVAHDTGNPGSTAAGNVAYYKRSANEESSSAHFFVDDREIIECIPVLSGTPERAWHVRYDIPRDNQLFGVDANDAAIGVEYCYGGRIDADQAYARYVWLFADLCRRFQLNPLVDIVGHYFLDPDRRTDPQTGLAASRRTVEQLVRDIAAEYEAATGTLPALPDGFQVGGQADTMMRVNVRAAAPNTRARIQRVLPSGVRVPIVGIRNTGESVAGNPIWLEIAQGEYAWSGAFRT